MIRYKPDPSCWWCGGSGRRPLDDAFGSEAILLECTEQTHTTCFCVIDRWRDGQPYYSPEKPGTPEEVTT